MEARNRTLEQWYDRICGGQIKLPRFQRFESWDRARIRSLLQTVVHNLPLGITLILEVGDQEKFVSRYLETTQPKDAPSVNEHLLDGQQRLTALWRTFHNNYPRETYFVYLEEFDNYDGDRDREDLTIHSQGRYSRKKDGVRGPLWCDDPADCLKRGMIPAHLLRPVDMKQDIEQWISDATAHLEPKGDYDELKQFMEMRQRVGQRINDLRNIVRNYNLPYLALPATTDKTVALEVFINMNTNSKPLSTYDIIVAEVENVMGQSLHDLVDRLNDTYPAIQRYSELPDLILTTSALLQGHVPNQRGAWDMDKPTMVEHWDQMAAGLGCMAEFLQNEGVYDRQRLPSNAVLAPIAALYARSIPESGDKRGRDELLLRRYTWHAFFSDRYENAASSHAHSDFVALRRLVMGEPKPDGTPQAVEDVPIFAEYGLASVDELATADWPKKKTICGRAILAVTCREGAHDFATGISLSMSNIGKRQYHHIFPDSLLKEASIESSFRAVNCALISDKTNLSIGNKDPLIYLADRYEWASKAIVDQRLTSHLIPIDELANGGYEGLHDSAKAEKVRSDFELFTRRRAELVHQVMLQLTNCTA